VRDLLHEETPHPLLVVQHRQLAALTDLAITAVGFSIN
jgi:hypothetical protein